MLPLPQGCSPERKDIHLPLLGALSRLHLGPDSLQGEDLVGWNWVFSGFPGGISGKETNAGDARDNRFDLWVGKIPLEEGMAIHSSILAWRILWQRILASCSPWHSKESETAEETLRAHTSLLVTELKGWAGLASPSVTLGLAPVQAAADSEPHQSWLVRKAGSSVAYSVSQVTHTQKEPSLRLLSSERGRGVAASRTFMGFLVHWVINSSINFEKWQQNSKDCNE